MQCTQVEEAFENFADDLSIRPIWHLNEKCIEAHVFTSLPGVLPAHHADAATATHAPCLTPRWVPEKLGTVQTIDVHIPTTDNREVVLTRYPEPEPELRRRLGLRALNHRLRPRPKITEAQGQSATRL